MAAVGRNLWVTAILLALLVLAAILLRSTLWLCALAALFGLAGVVLLRGNRWRSGALLVAALAVAGGLLDALAGWLAPQAHGAGLVTVTDPSEWLTPDANLGYRLRPDNVVVATATFDGQPVYRATYTVGPDGTRLTPAAPPGSDLYLFMGDSFMFGQGLDDDQHLAAQFARLNDFKVRTVNFSAPGWGPNHLVRAFEAGFFDRYAGDKVKAVVTWIIPDHLSRVTGDGEWLGASPRYVLENGKIEFTGSFSHYRWTHPLAGLRYQAGKVFSFIDAIGKRQHQLEQVELFDALLLRLRALAKEKLNAPLIVVYSWPDETSGPSYGAGVEDVPLLVALLDRLRKQGFELMSVDQFTSNIDSARLMFPHDGHPKAFVNGLIANGLMRQLRLDQGK
jgi:hypothetical protein